MEHRPHNLLWNNGTLGERIEAVHERLLRALPQVDRVACVLYDPGTDMLKTFVSSTRHGTPIDGYEFKLAESRSLSQLADSGECRVIDDIPAAIRPDSVHSKWLLEQGYRSSFTVPMHDRGEFIGMMFFNSSEPAAFSAQAQRDALLHGNLMTMTIAAEKDVARSILQSVQVIGELARQRDFEAGPHLDRMAHYSRLMALSVAGGYGLSDEKIEHIFLFAPLHDIGKVGISERILQKPGPLDEDERRVMQKHVRLGTELAVKVLDKLKARGLSDSATMLNIIAGHHEMMDGSGYPEGLAGDQVPVEARIVAVADVFDALTSRRPYKEPWPVAAAVVELRRMVDAGKLDETCVHALEASVDKIAAIRRRYPDA
jgi:HD-GYP domain-containing protein (c-di-GMP phosphodiesterase class II)